MPQFYKSQSHVRWDCSYHVVFAPKYRKKILFGHVRDSLRDIFKKLAKQKGIEIIEGTVKPDHVHMMLSIPPKYSVSDIIGFLKGKSAIALHNRFSSRKSVTQKSFWARGYFVRTTGLDQQMVEEYIRKQQDDDRNLDGDPQLDLKWN